MRFASTLLAAAACAPGAQADPAAWRVAGGDGGDGGELWLLGSVHYLREEDYPLPAVVDELYERAQAIVMELDMDDLDPSRAQGEFLSAAMLPAQTSLRAELGADLYELAEGRARELGFELRLLERFEPWLVAVTLLDRGMTQRGFSAERGVEQYVLGKAARDGKEVWGLESLATQIRVFDRLTAADQRSLLRQTLQELDSRDAAIDAMVDAWRDGRLETLADRLLEDFADFPGLYDALVVNRNRAWIEELERYLARPGDELVIVGALHLAGENSVVEMLRDRGFTVETLK